MTNKELVEAYYDCANREYCDGCPCFGSEDGECLDARLTVDDVMPRFKMLVEENRRLTERLNKIAEALVGFYDIPDYTDDAETVRSRKKLSEAEIYCWEGSDA